MLYSTSGTPVDVYTVDGLPALGGGGAAQEGTDPSTLTTLRQVATNTGSWRTTQTASALGNTIIVEHAIPSAATGLRCRFGAAGNIPVGALIPGRAGLVVRGQLHRLTVAGSVDISLERVQTVTTDPLEVVVEAGEVIYSVWEAPPSALMPGGVFASDTPIQRLGIGPFTGDIGVMDLPKLAGAPLGIYGLTLPTAASIACIGDSILEVGWMRRAADASGAAWSDISQWAEPIPSTPATLAPRLLPTDPPLFSLGLMEHATNNRILSPQEVRAELIAAWTWLTAGPIERLAQTTMTPYVDPTSPNLATLDGQMEINREWRDALNGWLRDGAPIAGGVGVDPGTPGALRAGDAGHPLMGICDIASACEAVNSRGEIVWDVSNGQPSADGVHPARAGSDLIEPYVAQWFAANL